MQFWILYDIEYYIKVFYYSISNSFTTWQRLQQQKSLFTSRMEFRRQQQRKYKWLIVCVLVMKRLYYVGSDREAVQTETVTVMSGSAPRWYQHWVLGLSGICLLQAKLQVCERLRGEDSTERELFWGDERRHSELNKTRKHTQRNKRAHTLTQETHTLARAVS